MIAGENHFPFVGNPESARINRYVAGMKEPYGKGEQRIHPALESCRRRREMPSEATNPASWI
jgi:hypothetical protein